MAIQTNPFAGQGSVISALRGTQEIIGSLGESFIENRRREREERLQNLELQFRGTQLQAERDIEIARNEADKERFLAEAEVQKEQDKLTAAFRMKQIEQGESRLDLAGREFALKEQQFERVKFSEEVSEQVGEGTVYAKHIENFVGPGIWNMELPRVEFEKMYKDALNNDSGVNNLSQLTSDIDKANNALRGTLGNPELRPGSGSYNTVAQQARGYNELAMIDTQYYLIQPDNNQPASVFYDTEEELENAESLNYDASLVRYEHRIVPDHSAYKIQNNLDRLDAGMINVVVREVVEKFDMTEEQAFNFVTGRYGKKVRGSDILADVGQDVSTEFIRHNEIMEQYSELQITGGETDDELRGKGEVYDALRKNVNLGVMQVDALERLKGIAPPIRTQPELTPSQQELKRITNEALGGRIIPEVFIPSDRLGQERIPQEGTELRPFGLPSVTATGEAVKKFAQDVRGVPGVALRGALGTAEVIGTGLIGVAGLATKGEEAFRRGAHRAFPQITDVERFIRRGSIPIPQLGNRDLQNLLSGNINQRAVEAFKRGVFTPTILDPLSEERRKFIEE